MRPHLLLRARGPWLGKVVTAFFTDNRNPMKSGQVGRMSESTKNDEIVLSPCRNQVLGGARSPVRRAGDPIGAERIESNLVMKTVPNFARGRMFARLSRSGARGPTGPERNGGTSRREDHLYFLSRQPDKLPRCFVLSFRLAREENK